MATLMHCVVLFLVVGTLLIGTVVTEKDVLSKDYDLDIRMPSVISNAPDSLICTGRALDPEEAYIVKFSPRASKETAHHLMVYGCTNPANSKKFWICNEPDNVSSNHSVCGPNEERQILFAWALDAPTISLPDGVGLRIAGHTSIKHIVIQIHYARKFSDDETDSSGITLHITHYRPPQQMGYYVLAHAGMVEPHRKDKHLDIACPYKADETIYPIGYRTHSHNLGVVTAGYRIRDGIWTEVGRMSPKLPQTFYKVSNPGMDIRKGDILVARCTMNSMSRNSTTHMGPRNHDEMCNFYIMYSTYNQKNLLTKVCFPPTSDFTWENGLTQFMPSPSDASSLEGVPNAEEIRKSFNLV